MMSELTFPKAPKRATHVRLTVGKYKKAIVPLKDKRRLLGFFLLGSEKIGHYYENMNTDLLEKLSNSVSIAIKLMRLYEKNQS